MTRKKELNKFLFSWHAFMHACTCGVQLNNEYLDPIRLLFNVPICPSILYELALEAGQAGRQPGGTVEGRQTETGMQAVKGKGRNIAAMAGEDQRNDSYGTGNTSRGKKLPLVALCTSKRFNLAANSILVSLFFARHEHEL